VEIMHLGNITHSSDDKLIKLVQSSTHNLMGSFRDKTEQLAECSNDIKLLIREGYDLKWQEGLRRDFLVKRGFHLLP